MIVKEGFPSLQWPTLPRHHVFRNRGLGNVDADLDQLTMDLGSAPERVLKTHSSDKVAHLFADPRSATKRTRLPSPVSGEAHSVPTHNGFGPDDGYDINDARKATIEPNEQGAVSPAQFQSTWCALSKHVQLMTQNQKFSVKPPSRLEAIAHHADEEEGDCNHQPQSCSDSGTAAIPADLVFGSDRRRHQTTLYELRNKSPSEGTVVGEGPRLRNKRNKSSKPYRLESPALNFRARKSTRLAKLDHTLKIPTEFGPDLID
jgi:hypothetical protein